MFLMPRARCEIQRINRELGALGVAMTSVRVPAAPDAPAAPAAPAARMVEPGAYQIEMVEDCLGQYRAGEGKYHLRVVRIESGRTISTAIGVQAMHGARQVIAEHEVTLVGDDAYCRLWTNLAPVSLGNDECYLGMGFDELLFHLLVYCCACARVRMNIYALHPAGVSMYAEYDAYYSRTCARAEGGVQFTLDMSLAIPANVVQDYNQKCDFLISSVLDRILDRVPVARTISVPGARTDAGARTLRRGAVTWLYDL